MRPPLPPPRAGELAGLTLASRDCVQSPSACIAPLRACLLRCGWGWKELLPKLQGEPRGRDIDREGGNRLGKVLEEADRSIARLGKVLEEAARSIAMGRGSPLAR